MALSALLLLNSRSQILQIDKGESVRKDKSFNEKRVFLDTSEISFDLSRILRKHPDTDEDAAEKLMAEQLVRGHFKLRKKGVYWWSHHFRNRDQSVSERVSTARQLKRGNSVDSFKDPYKSAWPVRTI